MITGLSIGNFKAFSDTQHVPIRPITLIFGPNSSGKSSLIHSLILAHHAMEKGELDVHRTTIGGESVDLGGFKQYIYHRETDRQLEWGIELNATKLDGRLAELFKTTSKLVIKVTALLSYTAGEIIETLLDIDIDEFISRVEKDTEAHEADEDDVKLAEHLRPYRYRSLKMKDIFDKKPQINTYSIDADEKPLIKMSMRKGGLLRLEYINSDHPIVRNLIKAILETSTTAIQSSPEDESFTDEAIAELVPQIATLEKPRFLPEKTVLPRPRPVEDILMPIGRSTRKEDLLAAIELFFPRSVNEIIEGLTAVIEKQVRRLKYLGPLRSYPPRHIAFAQYHDPNWIAGGGTAWDEVSRKIDLRNKVNRWLGDPNKLSTPYELTVQHLLTLDHFRDAHSKRVSEIEDEYLKGREGVQNEDGSITYYDIDLFGELYNIPEDLKAIEQGLSEVRELVLKDKRTDTIVSHRDVGIGVSQVLPVLVSAFANKDSLVAIEQPEIHLHPALQAELGDVFIESALGENKNTFIIETHSEHLILRLLRRIRETTNGELKEGVCPIRPEHIAVIYAQPTTGGTKLIELRVTDDGDFEDKWPDGFFAERAKELF